MDGPIRNRKKMIRELWESQMGKEAARLAGGERFAAKSVIFLDQEEGGRLLPEQGAICMPG